MDKALCEIIEALKAGESPDAAWLDRLVRRRNREMGDGRRTVAKRRLLPRYLAVKAHDAQTWERWAVSDDIDAAVVKLLQAKPRRTASGVATITVLTKPWPCSSQCLYCPNDIRMPKSYLSDEPACQRAERCWFDPYLQVAARLRALTAMGHVTDKVELIVLGGTWSDYPEAYQRWFIAELFRALNDDDKTRETIVGKRRGFYEDLGLPQKREDCRQAAAPVQKAIDDGYLTYNSAWKRCYETDGHLRVSAKETASWEALEKEHRLNEEAAKRVVGLVIETRPDLIDEQSCRVMRRLGCTKVQLGVQSLNDEVLCANRRNLTAERIAQAMEALRLAGFKTHVHFMVNLMGSSPEADQDDYERLVTDGRFVPDEVKLYPCVLVESSQLTEAFEDGSWQPYDEETLIGVLKAATAMTPPYTRISRMIRDISATDIVAGNKKTNLRQMVESSLDADGAAVREIRRREVSTEGIGSGDLRLETLAYDTPATEERFLQWVTADDRIAGFLRLSLPHHLAYPDAMIREVHVYGRVAALHQSGEGAQHRGLGTALIEEACRQAADGGYGAVKVISAVGTRLYYRERGFADHGLYQRRPLSAGDSIPEKARP